MHASVKASKTSETMERSSFQCTRNLNTQKYKCKYKNKLVFLFYYWWLIFYCLLEVFLWQNFFLFNFFMVFNKIDVKKKKKKVTFWRKPKFTMMYAYLCKCMHKSMLKFIIIIIFSFLYSSSKSVQFVYWMN